MNENATTSTPPHSAEAEMSVLGGILIDDSAVSLVLEFVQEEDFFRDAHRRLFRAMVSLWEQGKAIDPVTLSDQLRAADDYEPAGGVTYIGQLLDAVPTSANIEYHARIVARHAARRKLAAAAEQIGNLAREAKQESPEALVAEAERIVADVSPPIAGEGLVWARKLILPELDRIEKYTSEGAAEIGLRTGVQALDDRLGAGFEPGDFVLVAARPSMGKSALGVCNIAADVAIRQSKAVALFSVETPRSRVVNRLIGSEGRINMAALKANRRIEDHQYQRMAQATAKINQAKLFIDHTPGLTVDQMRVRLRKLEREVGHVALVVVDYLQLMSEPKAQRRYDEVSSISRGLKRIAAEFGCVVVALSQLSRAVEMRPDKRPMMSDLRESGTLEQDADVVVLIYRPEYYFGDEMTVNRGKEKRTIDVRGKAELILGKVRDGQTGSAFCRFEAPYTHFVDYSSPHVSTRADPPPGFL